MKMRPGKFIMSDSDDEDYKTSNQSIDPKMQKFDVKRTKYNIGPISPDNPTNQWELAELAADFAFSTYAQQQGIKLEFKGLVKAVMEVVAGVMYYVTFSAIDLNDQIERLYRAKVWAKIPTGLEFKFCEEFTDSTESPEEMLDKVNRVLAKGNKKPRPSQRFLEENTEISSHQVEDDEPPKIRVRNATHKELAINGFFILVKEIQEQNPGWKYSRARKAASKKWRVVHRLPYVVKAGRKWWDKNGIKPSSER